MSAWTNFPVIYELNALTWLAALSREHQQQISLATVPQDELERVAALGFDALWLMGVWQRSSGGLRVAQTDPALTAACQSALADFKPDDVAGSPFSIAGYIIDRRFGGDTELATLRERLRRLGLRLILDFIPNHMGLGHAWQHQFPSRLVQGTPGDLRPVPHRYFADDRSGSVPRVFAYGGALNYHVWPDVVQLDYRQSDTRRAMRDVLLSLAKRCDGVRCDMAMLVTRDVFLRTWGGQFSPPEAEFWPDAIADAKRVNPDFLLIAEVYNWGLDLEYKLQQQGFDYTYDKVLYDRLLGSDANSLLAHIRGGAYEFQRRLVRFIENHDEDRAAARMTLAHHRCAATIALTLPGLRLIHEGQAQGARVKLPVQLARRPQEPVNRELEEFYRRLLRIVRDPVFHAGHWRFIDSSTNPQPSPQQNSSVVSLWQHNSDAVLVVANFSPNPIEYSISADLPLLSAPTKGGTRERRSCLVEPTSDLLGREPDAAGKASPALRRAILGPFEGTGDPEISSDGLLRLAPWDCCILSSCR